VSAETDFETLAREFRSAGSVLMRYAYHQVLKTRDAAAIERMAQRKRRQATLGQGIFVAVVAIDASMAIPRMREEGWTAAGSLLLWSVITVAAIVWLQGVKRDLADAAVRIREHLDRTD